MLHEWIVMTSLALLVADSVDVDTLCVLFP